MVRKAVQQRTAFFVKKNTKKIKDISTFIYIFVTQNNQIGFVRLKISIMITQQTIDTVLSVARVEEVIFLKYHFNGKWVVENVNPYYEPMFNPKQIDRHTYWTNLNLPNKLSDRNDTHLVQASRIQDLCDFHDYDFRKYKGTQRLLKMARNLVDYEAGKTIFECALNIPPKRIIQSLFDEQYQEIK